MAAFEKLGVNRLVLISPYVRSIHEHEIEFLEEAGFDIVSERNLGCKTSDGYCGVQPAEWIETLSQMKDDRADVYFVSCANIRAIEVLEEMETMLEAPVVTSNQLVIWQALRLAGVDEPIPGLGRLTV